MKFSSLIALAGLAIAAICPPLTATAQYHTLSATPDVYVVMFRADYCAPCRIVEPRLSGALQSLADPAIEYVELDTGSGNGDWNANAVFDRGIVQQYNRWLGITGFAAIIDGDTKQTLGCVNMDYDQAAMASHIRNLQGQARQNQQSFDLTCPEANNAL